MKKIVLMLMAVTMMLPMANAQELTKQQAKAVKKEVSKIIRIAIVVIPVSVIAFILLYTSTIS